MPTNQERIDFAMHFVRGAEEIAHVTKVTSALRAWKFCYPRICICLPGKCDDDGFSVRSLVRMTSTKTLEPSQAVCILPLFAEDVTLGYAVAETWDYLKIAAATAVRGSNTIILSTRHKESPFVSGCILLHEMGHYVCDVRSRLSDVTPPPASGLTQCHLQEEVEMHTQNYLLWQERGGDRYTQLIEKSIYWIKKRLKRIGKGKFLQLETVPWDETLHDILGPCDSQVVRNFRMTELSIHAHFALFDRLSDKERAAHGKREIMRTVYAKFASRVGGPIIRPPRPT